MKIIVLGTGIAGYGAYLACKDLEKLNDEVVFYNYGKKIQNKLIKISYFPSLKFPVKKEFGEDYQATKVENSKFKIRYSTSQGGLSDFWSGSVFPFSNYELERRNLNFLKKFYESIAKKIDIMGPKDISNPFFEKYRIAKEFESTEPLKCFDSIRYEEDEFLIHSENNNVLTSSDCVMCGECFSGCDKNVIFRPMKRFDGANIQTAKIDRILKVGQTWQLLDLNQKVVDTCDVLFLACGTFQTIKLLNNSKLLDCQKVEIYDSNAIIFGMKLKSTKIRYIKNYSYANKIISIEGKNERRFDSQVSIVPFNHFITESIFGKIIGKIFNGIFLNNFALGMFFSSANESNIYKLSSDNKLYVSEDNSNLAKNTLRKISEKFNESNNNFKIFNFFRSADSSVHYSSNLLDPNEDFYLRSQYLDNLYVIDGNLFPGRPAANGNSFSIMAGSYAVVKNFFTSLI